MKKLFFLLALNFSLLTPLSTDANSWKFDKFVKKSCEQVVRTSVRRGFTYDVGIPRGIRNLNNWSYRWHKEVNICKKGNECGFLKASLDRLSNKADKLVYKFMGNEDYTIICYVDQKSSEIKFRSIEGRVCDPRLNGCMSICDNWGMENYNCADGREN